LHTSYTRRKIKGEKEKDMNIFKNKTLNATIALVLMSTIAAMSIVSLPAVNAMAVLPSTVKTTAYLSLRPTTIGVGQEWLINCWVCPCLQRSLVFVNPYTITLTDPDGVNRTLTLQPLGADNTAWSTYVPDKVGVWKAQMSFPGETIPEQDVSPLGAPVFWFNETYYTPCTSPVTELVVQQEPVDYWPAAQLPDYWEYPVSLEYREWAYIMGPWTGENPCNLNFNPYCRAPNSAHVAWKILPIAGVGGMKGGYTEQTRGIRINTTYTREWQTPVPIGAASYSATSVSLAAIVAGRAYATGRGMSDIICYDVRTGEELWSMPGSFSAVEYSWSGGNPQLYQIGSTFSKYNAFTGAQTFTMTGTMSGTFVDPFVYSVQTIRNATGWIGLNTTYRLIKWDTRGSSTNFQDRIIYNVSYPSRSIARIWRDLGVFINSPTMSYWDQMTGVFNTTTGEVLWNVMLPFDEEPYSARSTTQVFDGKIIYAVIGHRALVARDIYTGERLWMSDQANYPWGEFWAYASAAAPEYNMYYGLTYDGIYGYNATNGKLVWHYSAGNAGYETPYNTWPFFGSIRVADGKVYAQNTEHTPTLPLYRGAKLHCVDAFTGEGLWNITMPCSLGAVAEGYLTGVSGYDSVQYVFGKGPSATTVSVLQSTITNGSSAYITGRVTDESPAQPGTPCVSKESMAAWMEYLHTQKPCPTDTTGVPVQLLAMRSDGSMVNIGTVTSDGHGDFSYVWTPPDEDIYKITATFLGDDSYYSSWNLTTLAVGPAPVTPEPAEPIDIPAYHDYTQMFYVVIAAIAVVAVIGVVSLFWKRK
jgi:outer membrane protein assembly factor BamB